MKKGVIQVGVLLLAALVVVAVMYLGGAGTTNNFLSIFGSTFPGGDPGNLENQFAGYTVTLSVSPPVICAGASVTGKIKSNIPRGVCRIYTSINNGAWQQFADVNLDASGGFETTQAVSSVGSAKFGAICCDADAQCKVSNIVALTVNPCTTTTIPPTTTTIPGWHVGDVVGSESGSGSVTGTQGLTGYIDLSSIELGGDCYLGARIHTSWDYESLGACYNDGGIPQGFEWVFVDSSNIKWSYADASPQAHNVELCPLNWDGKTAWKLSAWPFYDIPGCVIDYSYSIEVFVCECN